MNVLLTAATYLELKPLCHQWQIDQAQTGKIYTVEQGNLKADLLFTGVGAPAVVFQLTRHLLQTRYDLVLQAGIAGTFNQSIAPGSVLEITEDQFADLGAEDGAAFLDIFSMQLADPAAQPFTNGKLIPLSPPPHFPETLLPKASGITINTTTGSDATAAFRTAHFKADTESMEGAACFYVCNQLLQPALQVRSISNYVEKRNKANWNIPLAVEQLNIFLKDYFNKLA